MLVLVCFLIKPVLLTSKHIVFFAKTIPKEPDVFN